MHWLTETFLALLVVGFPIWAVHWWLIQRGIATDEAEARSAIRSAFFTAVLTVTLVRWTAASIEIMRQLFAAALGVGEPAEGTAPRVLSELALLLAVGGVWLGHVSLMRRARWSLSLTGPADWLPRLYGYAAALTGLSLLVWAVADSLTLLVDALLFPRSVIGTRLVPLSRDLALLVTGLVVWSLHWGEALRLTARFVREQRSLVRWAYLGFVVFSGLTGLLVAVALSLHALLRWLLGVPDGDLADRLRQLLEPVPWAVVTAIVWWYHRRTMQHEARALTAQPGTGRDWATETTRSLVYLSAFVSLVVTLIGCGGLIGTLIDVVLATIGSGTLGTYRESLALELALVLVGGGAWLASWRTVILRTARSPADERRSLSRRVYLFAVLGLGVLVLLGTLGFVVYEVILWIVGLTMFSAAIGAASEPLGFALVAALFLAYHASVLAQDSRVLEKAPTAVTVRLVLRLPPGTDPDAVVQDLATALPEGAVLERVS